MLLGRLVTFSVRARHAVVALVMVLAVAGVHALRDLPVDALPDISDPQVIVRTPYAGHDPAEVEREVTRPLASALAASRDALAVRGVSMYGESFLYIVFSAAADRERLRARVLERLSEVEGRLPVTAIPALGPDASGVGWALQYVLKDPAQRHAPDALRTLQENYLKLELQSVPGVAEVATVGGEIREFRIDLDPRRAAARGVTPDDVSAAVRAANQAAGGGALDLGQRRVMLDADNRLQDVDDLRAVPLARPGGDSALRLTDVATVSVGPAAATGVVDLDGRGAVTGGIVILRQGENVLAVTSAVKQRLRELTPGLPAGVQLSTVYDRTRLIEQAVTNLGARLLEEAAVVLVVCLVMLWSLRAALATVLVLPAGLLCAALLLRGHGVELNIMSLGGVAIAVGAMTDAAIVMTENVNRRLAACGTPAPRGSERLRLIALACAEVGPALFYSLLLITVSFLPVLLLGAREGRLFAPLVYTKTYLMAVACVLAVTLTPALLALWVHEAEAEEARPWLAWAQRGYRRLLGQVLRQPRVLLLGAVLALLSLAWPITHSGAEFMPPLDEGTLLYMPTTLTSITRAHAAELLRRSDALIATVPEVEHVFGKAGRADTATDPAPLSMFETTITLRPREQWRAGMSSARLLDELQRIVQLPGLLNSWGYPIRTRIAMLSSGVKTPLGLRITASDWRAAEQLALAAAARLQTLPGLRSATPSRGGDGDYLALRLRQPQAAALGVDAAMLGQFAALITGPEPVTYINGDGATRFPVTLRLASQLRDDLATLGALPLATRSGSVPLATVATLARQRGPSEIQSEGGRAAAYVYIDIDNDDVQAFVAAASARLASLPLPVGTALAWVGEYQDYARARQRLLLIAPLVLLTVLLLLLAVFREPRRALLVIASLPFALIGSVWLTYLLDFQFSVAVAVGMLALAGVAAEFSVIMVLYLDNAVRERGLDARALDAEQWRAAVTAGAVQRLRPKLMTVAVISFGLLPVLWSEGAGCDVMQRIAAPMVGGMVTAPLLSMLLVPLIYHRWFYAWPPRDV